MRSPFPGMDPYLERHWPDVHTRLVTYAADWLNEKLPPGLVASTEERVAIESDEERIHRAGPDVNVFAPASADPQPGTIMLDAPFKLVVELDPVVERYMRILDTDGEKLITVIEVLSPANKIGEGLEEYRQKRDRLHAAGVHVVEIDLVRRGNWRALMRPYSCPVEAVTAYRAIIYMGSSHAAYLFPMEWRSPLPAIPVPLRPGDQPVNLPLGELLDQLYARGRYAQRVDYSQPCDPPMTADEQAVVGELVSKRS